MVYELAGKREFTAVSKSTGKEYEGSNLFLTYNLDPDDDRSEGIGCKVVFCKPENVEGYDRLTLGSTYRLYFNEYGSLEAVVEELIL